VTTTLPATIDGTVVFTDIVGFTEYTALQGDAEALALLTAQEDLVNRLLPDGARIVKELGDGLLLWFPEASSAISTCVELQTHFEQEAEESLLPLGVRIGVHAGTQTVRRDDLVGHDVNLASRIADVAGPGEVLVSEATIEQARAVPGGQSYEDSEELGPVMMKGIPEPVRLFRICSGEDEVW